MNSTPQTYPGPQFRDVSVWNRRDQIRALSNAETSRSVFGRVAAVYLKRLRPAPAAATSTSGAAETEHAVDHAFPQFRLSRARYFKSYRSLGSRLRWPRG